MKRPAIIEKKPCIYMIQNVKNGKVYIGSSINGNKRYREHLYDLKRGDHRSSRLQNSFNRYGSEAFVFIVLKYTERENLREEEARLIRILDSTNREKGYNMSDLTELGVLKHTETSKEKMRKAGKGRKHTEASKENMRKSQQARVANLTDEERKVLSDNGKKAWKGKSQEQIRAHCKKASNVANKKRARAVICSNGARFDSLADAGRFFGVGTASIHHLVKKQRPGGVSGCGKFSKLKGLTFKYEKETNNG